LLPAIEPFGFALGGGAALQLHGISDRMTMDIDSFTNEADDEVFEDA